ncbi:MAG: thioredoxin domain-containing protein, partial [Desulforhopalus sp.]
MSWIIAVIVTSLFFVFPETIYSEGADNLIDKEIQRRLAMGEKPNRLIEQKSPYLLQHAFNPVDWHPWGEEAFAKATTEDKPIFLSIGYSTCHWCHVMADESFESPEVAALLNKWFISIKVDREERPDIDQMYMAATQALSGSGGWPMSVFLLPDGSPFYAGTYFPPTSSQHRPGFSELLTALHQAWQQKRGDLNQSAQELVAALKIENKESHAIINPEIIKRGFWLFAQDNDPTYGGFSQAPKFPRPAVLSFLFDYYHVTGEEKPKDMALHTLQKMAAGGIYDHLGGGFHRYSVDKRWFVPHFEKMLYDQSQLANVYLDAFLITGEKRYSQITREIFDYLLRDMRDPLGGFYSAEDADSDNPYASGEHGEGAYYLWTEEDINRRLGQDDAALFIYSYGVQSGGNVAQDPLQEFTGRNILYRAHSPDETAAHLQVDRKTVNQSLARSKEMLFQARSDRKRPHLDDKIITGWNGLLIGALARGSRLLEDPALLEHAKQAATFIKNHLYDEKSQTLYRRYRAGESGLSGQL